MPRSCTICTHEQRNEIERAVVLQTRYRKIAALYGVSPGPSQDTLVTYSGLPLNP